MVAPEFNDTGQNPSRVDECLTDLLDAWAAKHPEDISVIQDDRSLTFRELVNESDAIAAQLRHRGVVGDDRVGVFLEPSPDLVTGIWGVLYAGGSYLPLAPEYPDERLRYMIEDSGTRLLLTDERLRSRLADLAPAGTPIITVGEAMAARASARTARAPEAAAHRGAGHPGGHRAGRLAYVIYTSGSTGRPKGVMVEHRAIASQMRWLHWAQQVGPGRRVLQKTPMSFDAAQWEILAPVCGATVVVAPSGAYRDPELLIRTINAQRVTTLQCVPTLLQALLDTGELGGCTSLRQIFSGGEALSRALALRCLSTLPGCDLVNLYGPTECTINASAYLVDPTAVAHGPTMVPIGTPAHQTEFHLLDARLAPVAVGETGELHIGGVQLARGYLNQPALTAQRFMADPFRDDGRPGRLYRTGDLAYRDADGTVHFVGRTDNQVKLRGYRVELDEIRLLIENHDWVRSAAVVVRTDPRTAFQNLVAFVELNPNEAALMDQGNHGTHHQSKQNRLQIRTQLKNLGCRDAADLRDRPTLPLPGKVATTEQRRQAFARKTYRFFEGGPLRRADILRVLGRRPVGMHSRELADLTLAELGEILRYLGPHHSPQRLLPKYAYASPGSLYATQLYLETTGLLGLRPGYHYHHPLRHELVRIGEAGPGPAGAPPDAAAQPRIVLHFVGRHRAIEPVYKNNIREVLEIEAGHMVGLLGEILPRYGLTIRPAGYPAATMAQLECPAEDHYLGAFELVPYRLAEPADEQVELYLQAHPGKVADLPAGQYRYAGGDLVRISDELVLKRHVIAINQQVYERAAIGVTVVSRVGPEWLRYVELGRTLQRLQLNDQRLGLMSAGYSSRSGNDLPSARRFRSILREPGTGDDASYFAVGGRVSEEQVRGEGMKEDVVHMQGPAEIVRDDLTNLLPDYMVPNRVTVLDRMPLTANGKIDHRALVALDRASVEASAAQRPFVAPRTATERRIATIWQRTLRRDDVSIHDDFFESGGNSLSAVSLVNAVNRELGRNLPMQVLFESSTVHLLAGRVDAEPGPPPSRLVPLRTRGAAEPVYCWPGLGGYPMNLRPLAARVGLDRPFYGVQAYGINDGEVPYPTIAEMAAEDIRAIRLVQPAGPYTLWGYSFGARVAFEVACQLERAGERVAHLFLIAPGAPGIDVGPARSGDTPHADEAVLGGEADYLDEAYLTILFSVFAGVVTGRLRDECLRTVRDEESFVAFASERFDLDPALVRRITHVVRRTYRFTYEFRELSERKLAAPITIFKANGDDYTAVEHGIEYLAEPPTVIELAGDHYRILKDPGVGELARGIRRRLGIASKEESMPHVNIKHFPVSLTEEQQAELVTAVTSAVKSAFQCDEGVISIALEPVDQEAWHERVYVPEIVNRKELLRKTPNY